MLDCVWVFMHQQVHLSVCVCDYAQGWLCMFVCSGTLHGAEKRDSYEVKLPWKLSATGGGVGCVHSINGSVLR